MKPSPAVLIAAIPLLLLGADSGPQRHDVTIRVDGLERNPVFRSPKPYPLEIQSLAYNSQHKIFLFNRETGETWEYFQLLNDETNIDPGWRRVRFYIEKNLLTNQIQKPSAEQFLNEK